MPFSNRRIVQKLSSYLGFIFLCVAAVMILLQLKQGAMKPSYGEYFGSLFIVCTVLLLVGKLLD